MRNKNYMFLLLISLPINVSADERPVLAADAKTQPAPSVAVKKPDIENEKKPASEHELTQQDLEIARLRAEIERKQALYGRPKRKFISASTQDPIYHEYMVNFVRKIEDVGNANYPEEFKRKNINAKVTLTISIGRDGALEEVSFNDFNTEKPADISVIKEGVLKIVAASVPFAPLPETAQKIDFLHITRTWAFGDGN